MNSASNSRFQLPRAIRKKLATFARKLARDHRACLPPIRSTGNARAIPDGSTSTETTISRWARAGQTLRPLTALPGLGLDGNSHMNHGCESGSGSTRWSFPATMSDIEQSDAGQGLRSG